MPLELKQISALHKTRPFEAPNYEEKNSYAALQGQRLSYQVIITATGVEHATKRIWIESELRDYIRLYRVKDVVVDMITRESFPNEDYLISEPGLLPDVLIPLEHQNNLISTYNSTDTIWVKVDIPADCKPGMYTVKTCLESGIDSKEYECCEMQINVLPAKMPEQSLIYTRWFYADCIADAHNVEIFSEHHWMLIEEYIKAATDVGINMILVPTHTPPLDTEVGTVRPCVQLVDIEKFGDVYEFKFDKFKRFIDICKKHNVKYYEIAHLFTQWGSKCAPNIMVTENGKTDYMFGWHVPADSKEYRAFLKQYIKAIFDEMAREGIADNAYFHISDEPTTDNLDKYKIAKDIIRPLIGDAKTFDALSHYEFCERGLVECPVSVVSKIHDFIDHDIKELWAYYCCEPETIFTNSFIAMPSCRTQILGYQIYKYNVKGFLHWGYNFYNARVSLYNINPYLTTSADHTFPSGDGFIVYPGKDTAYPSIRGEITYEAIQDINICRALEAIIGREAVINMIDEAAGRDLRFDDYPSDIKFLEDLRERMLKVIAENTK